MRISIDYKTEENQSVYLSGNIPGLGNWNELVAVPMVKISDSSWELQLEVEATEIQYRYLIRDNENNII
ncbi:MAG: hypothetical protein LBQ60_19130, partial [Bacteroidales bacterium]|nr:hypothetical protein [Bacteroidales bacterium]